ncbi:MAG: HEPN domain-containing protein [Tenuifilaceae bacterium]
MKQEQESLIKYRMERAWDTLDDAKILISSKKWNSSINRLYYASYYAVMALLLKHGLKPATHNGAKTNFTEHFIKSEKIDKKFGKLYAQLFTWRQKGDYDDLFDFEENQVVQYVEPVKEFLSLIETLLKE